MKYLFVLISIVVFWIAQLVIASFLGTDARFELYLIAVTFTFMLYLLGFLQRA